MGCPLINSFTFSVPLGSLHIRYVVVPALYFLSPHSCTAYFLSPRYDIRRRRRQIQLVTFSPTTLSNLSSLHFQARRDDSYLQVVFR